MKLGKVSEHSSFKACIVPENNEEAEFIASSGVKVIYNGGLEVAVEAFNRWKASNKNFEKITGILSGTALVVRDLLSSLDEGKLSIAASSLLINGACVILSEMGRMKDKNMQRWRVLEEVRWLLPGIAAENQKELV